jgi:hypothetical protein
MNKFRKLGFIHYNGGGIHIWDKKDAWLEGQAVPNGDPRRTSV